MTTTRTPASGAADKVLAYLDDLSDDAAAHIFPSDLAKCMTSECVVEVVSVRAGNPNERTVPLFSREQVVAALASATAQPITDTNTASGAANREIEDCPELNLSNYGSDDVDRLNDWAIRADEEIDRLRAALASTPALSESFLEIPDVQDESGINAYYSREPTTDLLKRCAEIYEWRSTGLLSGEALRDYAKQKWPDLHDTLQMAEHETVTEALALLAKWGQPAQKTVTVVPATGDVWLKHDDDLRYVRRVLEAGRQMTDVDQRAAIDIVQGLRVTARSTAVDAKKPAQAASSAVLKAIREANMQLVRTGDDAFMLVPYKAVTAQAAKQQEQLI